MIFTPGARAVERLFQAYWALYFSLQACLAARLTIDYYDAFENLRNARRLAGAAVGYTDYRPLLGPLLHAPLQKALDFAGAGLEARLIGPHLLQALVSALMLLAFYKYLRTLVPPLWAQAGTALLSLNRMTVHYFPSVLSDIPAALSVLLFLHAASRRPRWAWAALAVGLLSRWNMLIVPALLLVLPAPVQDRKYRVRLAVGVVAAYFAFALIAVAVRSHVSRLDWLSSAKLAAETIWSQYRAQQGPPESALEYLQALLVSAGPLVCLAGALAVIGALAARGDAALRFHAAFFLAFLVATAFGVDHKEARYLWPALPSLYVLATCALKRAYERLAARGRGAQAALLALCLACAAPGALTEARRFGDPAYRDRTLLEVSALIDGRGAGIKTFWTGFAYSIVPREHRFTAQDDYYYLYHIPSPASVAYLTGRPIYRLPPAVEDGSLLVAAPERLHLLERPLPPAQNAITVSLREADRWAPLARWP